MYIIGTAGHIDHGKTSLIESLTGTDCDRLPQEKDRGMTIDLGFAFIDLEGAGRAGIIDVPGHERFIRNMVSGAWGMDLGILVIAADDGWMPQTEDHLQVLELMNVGMLLVALTKVDLVDPALVDSRKQQIASRLQSSSYPQARVIPFSAKTGEGKEEIIQACGDILNRADNQKDNGKPFLHVDRAFNLKGQGRIVTGTIRNGSFRLNQNLLLLPGGFEVRIRSIEGHNRSLEKADAGTRTALNLSGSGTDSLARGSLLQLHPFFTITDECLVSIRQSDENPLRNNREVEFSAGTATRRARFIDFSTDNEKLTFARLRFFEPWHCYPGEPCVFTLPGGHRIAGGGTVILPEIPSTITRSRLRKLMESLKHPSLEELLGLQVSIRGIVTGKNMNAIFPHSETIIEETLNKLMQAGSIVNKKDYWIDREIFDIITAEIANITKGQEEISRGGLARKAGIPADDLMKIIEVSDLGSDIIQEGGKLKKKDSGPDLENDMFRDILKKLSRADIQGVELRKTPLDTRLVKPLVKAGKAVLLEGDILYHRDVYDRLSSDILSLLEGKEKITIADAKAKVPLSRKYLIPLLDRMEKDGMLKRYGDYRVRP